MKLSIIIVNYNTGGFLKDCLLSIKKASLAPNDYEVIIVDNDSGDDSLKQALQVSFAGLHLIKNHENTGFARGNNQGIKKSKGDYILLLNPDTLVEKNTFLTILDYMDNQKEVGIATCKVLLADGSLDDACHRGFPTPWNAFCHFSGLSKVFPGSKLLNGYHQGFCALDKIHQIDSCVGAFMMIRRQTGEELFWLDEDYFWYGEDIDFCYRAKLKNWKVMFVPTVKIIHHKGISSGIKSHTKHQTNASSQTRKAASKARFDVMRIFYQKHYIHKYPRILTSLVLMGINIKEKLAK